MKINMKIIVVKAAFLMQCSLSLAGASGTKPTTLKLESAAHAHNLFIGTGIWSGKHGLSIGLPIDMLSMIVTAEQTRRSIEKEQNKESKTIILIADHLAIESGANADQAVARAKQNQIILNRVALALGIKCKVVLSSTIVNAAEYKKIKEDLLKDPKMQKKQIEPAHQNYVHTQTALGRYMQTHLDVSTKIGWGDTTNKLDERYYDEIYKSLYGVQALNFIYTKPGIAYQKVKAGARAPYSHTPLDGRENDLRVLFFDDHNSMSITRDDLKNKMNKAAASHYKRMIGELRTMGCKLVKSQANEHRLDAIVDDLNTIINLSRPIDWHLQALPVGKVLSLPELTIISNYTEDRENV